MFLRNRELAHILLAWAVLTAVLALAAWHASGAAAALWALGASLLAGAVFLVATWARYRKIARLTERLDGMLHGERTPGFEDMREGELAILANELDKLMQRLTISNERLERERTLLADSLADISHQLKTPLTSLTITTELVRKRLSRTPDGLDADGVAEVSSRLRTAAWLQERIRWLVSTLLKLARIDAGTVSLARSDVDVAALVDEASSELALAFEIAGVELDVDVEPGAHFTGDMPWSVEALVNVLKNCLEHTPAGGRVTVRATEDALACRIRVTDAGTGIAEEDLPHVFERFYRGNDAAAASSEVNPTGVGIGLSLARSLITAQDGCITAGNVHDGQGRVCGAAFDIVFFKAVV